MSATGILVIAAVVVLAMIALMLVRRVHPTPESPTSLYIRALDTLVEGDEAGAIDLLRETVRRDSANVPAYLRLGSLFRRRGEFTRATRIHMEVSRRPGIDQRARERALSELALDHRAQGQIDRALATLEELRHLNDRNVFAYEAAAEILEERGDWEGAFDLRKTLYRITGDEGSALATFHAHVGRVFALRGDEKAAREHFKEAFRKDRENLAARIYVGDLRCFQGRLDDAVDVWKEVVRDRPECAPWVYGRLEKAFFDLGRFETMMDVYEEVLARRPDDMPTLLAMARLHHKKGDFEGAERIVQRVQEAAPGEPLPRLYMGVLRAEQDDARGAAEALDDLLQKGMEALYHRKCTRCGHEADEILWRCPHCGAWGSFEGCGA